MIKNTDYWQMGDSQSHGEYDPLTISQSNKPFGVAAMIDKNNALRFVCPHCLKEIDLQIQVIGEIKP